MTRIPKSMLLAALACTVLSGCGPHLKKLGVCSGGKYRYANPHGVSLPSLDVPTPDEVSGATGTVPAPSQPVPAAPSPQIAPTPDAAPGQAALVASPPKHGAMLLPAPGSTLFGSC